MVAVLLFNKHNKFSPYPSDQSVPISSKWLKYFISFLCGSVLIVSKLRNIRPFDVTLTPLCLNLNISYNVHAAISHHLQSRLLSYLNLFMFFSSCFPLNFDVNQNCSKNKVCFKKEKREGKFFNVEFFFFPSTKKLRTTMNQEVWKCLHSSFPWGQMSAGEGSTLGPRSRQNESCFFQPGSCSASS